MALTAPIAAGRKAGSMPRLLHVTDCFPGPAEPESETMRAACDRGHAIHELTELHDRGEDVAVPQTYAGYVISWRSFLSDTGAKIEQIELRIGGDALGYVGRLDRILRIGRHLYVVDIKSGAPWPTHALQTAAYEYAYRIEHLPKNAKELRRACVYLGASGNYRVKYHDSVHDLNTFLAYLRIARWEIVNGLRPMPKGRD